MTEEREHTDGDWYDCPACKKVLQALARKTWETGKSMDMTIGAMIDAFDDVKREHAAALALKGEAR